jgi:hypothetical protein
VSKDYETMITRVRSVPSRGGRYTGPLFEAEVRVTAKDRETGDVLWGKDVSIAVSADSIARIAQTAAINKSQQSRDGGVTAKVRK